MKLSHILVEQKYEAEDITRRLKLGESFAELAKKYSRCPSASDGGDLGDVDLRRLDPTFAEAAQELPVGATSTPIRTRFGYHLILRPLPA